MRTMIVSVFIIISYLMIPVYCQEIASSVAAPTGKWVLVIHGGAGGSAKGNMTEAMEKEYMDKLKAVLQKGSDILKNGGSSLDAVETCIRIMEDSPLFNAGKGAVHTDEGKIELDASIMDGQTGKAGAVGCVTTIKNPISAARAVMEKSKHVFLVADGAEKFAKEQKLEIVDPSYFYIPERKNEDQKKNQDTPGNKEKEEGKHGTCGVVAMDMSGNLAAGTSTGGMTNKMHGRLGDSPIIGAGTFASNSTCAVSCSGHGEYFIRNVVAYDISALMEYKGIPLEEAAKYVIMEKLKSKGAEGGLIAVDKEGNIAMTFNTKAMFRGYITSEGQEMTAVY